jgi:hypothetical protein
MPLLDSMCTRSTWCQSKKFPRQSRRQRSLLYKCIVVWPILPNNRCRQRRRDWNNAPNRIHRISPNQILAICLGLASGLATERYVRREHKLNGKSLDSSYHLDLRLLLLRESVCVCVGEGGTLTFIIDKSTLPRNERQHEQCKYGHGHGLHPSSNRVNHNGEG